MRKGILLTILAGFTFASAANAAEMIRYERDYYAEDDGAYSQQRAAKSEYKQRIRKESRDTRFDSQHRAKHPIKWVAKERE